MAKEYKYQDGSYMATAQSNRENDNKDSNKDKNKGCQECQECCVGGTRWGGSFLSPQDPPFPPYL